MDVDISLTANSPFQTSISGYCSQTHTLQELVSERDLRQALGICKNPNCYMPEKCEKKFVKLSSTPYIFHYTTTNQSHNACPLCGHGLFWAKKWAEVPAEIMLHELAESKGFGLAGIAIKRYERRFPEAIRNLRLRILRISHALKEE